MIFKKEMGASNYEWLIVGLGNPGTKYEFTRHNAGFLCVDLYAEKNSFKIDRIKFKGTLSDVRIKGKRCLFLKPQTFMNLSGESVREVASFYKIPPERIIVIFDDVSLDVGKMRIRRKGTDGGHNGIKNIIYHLGSTDFPRIKIGVGKKPHPDYDLADWVLSPLPLKDRETVSNNMDKVYDAVCDILDGDFEKAMGKYN